MKRGGRIPTKSLRDFLTTEVSGQAMVILMGLTETGNSEGGKNSYARGGGQLSKREHYFARKRRGGSPGQRGERFAGLHHTDNYDSVLVP